MCKMTRFLFLFLIVFLQVSLYKLGVNGAIDDRFKDDIFHIYKNHAILTRDDIKKDPVTADKVTYYLFTRNNPKVYIKLDTNKLDVLAKQSKIVFIIHGWINSRDVTWYQDLTDAFLKRDDCGVVQVDWMEPANQLYSVSSVNTYDVAKHIANVIIDLHENYNVPMEKFLLVGHSLGGQICGFVGKRFYKKTLKKLPRIVALDPAGPFFNYRPLKERLNKNDAEVVVALHTDGGTFGFLDPCGTIDFYANGGVIQPGCKSIDLLDLKTIPEPTFCDHLRAYMYFTEAIVNPEGFMAKKCRNWAMYKAKFCDNEEVALGDLSTVSTGNFYFDTNKEPPFGKKTKTLLSSIPVKLF